MKVWSILNKFRFRTILVVYVLIVQRLEIQELGGWRVLFWKNQVSEGYGELGLRSDPSIGDDSDEKRRGQRLEHGDKEMMVCSSSQNFCLRRKNSW